MDARNGRLKLNRSLMTSPWRRVGNVEGLPHLPLRSTSHSPNFHSTLTTAVGDSALDLRETTRIDRTGGWGSTESRTLANQKEGMARHPILSSHIVKHFVNRCASCRADLAVDGHLT